MKKILLSSLLLSFFLIAKSQDIGVNKLIYPNTPFSVYELSSYVPVYWEIANLGEDTIENRIVTLTLHAEGSSPRFTEFESRYGSWFYRTKRSKKR